MPHDVEETVASTRGVDLRRDALHTDTARHERCHVDDRDLVHPAPSIAQSAGSFGTSVPYTPDFGTQSTGSARSETNTPPSE